MSQVVIDPPASETDADVVIPTEQTTPKQVYADWPQPNDQRAQPWDSKKNGTVREDHDRLLDNPGSINDVAPVVISHSMPILSSGSGGEQSTFVRELARRLHILGYQTDIGTGNNPYGIVTQSVMGAVDQFRNDHNVEEDPGGFGGDNAKGRDKAASHIGPYTWEAIIRASERKLASA